MKKSLVRTAWLLQALALGWVGPRPASALEAQAALSKKLWVKVSAGYDFSLMEDMNKGADAYSVFLEESGAGPSYSYEEWTGQSGIRTGLGVGLSLSAAHAFSLEGAVSWGPALGWSHFSDPTTGTWFKISPALLETSLNYHLVLARSGLGETRVTAGVGYFQALVGMDYFSSGSPDIYRKGEFSADTFGGTLGFTQTVDLGGGFGVALTAKGRYAKFGHLTATTIEGSTSSGPYYLVIVRNENSGLGLSSASNYLIYTSKDFFEFNSDGYRLAEADFSGFSGDISFILEL